MTTLTSLGFIGGGQMAEALIRGISEAHLLPADKILLIEPTQKRRDFLLAQYQVQSVPTPQELCAQCEVLIAAVKPQMAEPILKEYASFLDDHHLLISIMAGVTLETLGDFVGNSARLIRAMPNTPALVLTGATAFSPDASATLSDCQIAMTLFQAVGSALQVPEQILDAVTGLSGSGPGYVFTFLEALIDGGVLAGLPRPGAEQLAIQTLLGSAFMALETKEHPAVLKARVTSPGGTTIAGIHALEQGGFRGLVMDAVQKASKRSKELGS